MKRFLTMLVISACGATLLSGCNPQASMRANACEELYPHAEKLSSTFTSLKIESILQQISWSGATGGIQAELAELRKQAQEINKIQGDEDFNEARKKFVKSLNALSMGVTDFMNGVSKIPMLEAAGELQRNADQLDIICPSE